MSLVSAERQLLDYWIFRWRDTATTVLHRQTWEITHNEHYPNEWAIGFHTMLDTEELVTVRWDQVEEPS